MAMRISAPLVSVAAIGLAAALVWYVRPHDAPSAPDATEARAPAEADVSRPPDDAPVPSPTEMPLAERAPEDVPPPERSPLPGEAPATPMTQLLSERQQNIIARDDANRRGVPPQVAEGEREFAAEPVDAAWAPGAEAELFAKLATVPSLKLIDLKIECRSTMCRVQLTQPAPAPGAGNAPPFGILTNDIGLKPRWMITVGGGPPGAPPGPMQSIAYLWRDGFAPEPAVDEPHEQN